MMNELITLIIILLKIVLIAIPLILKLISKEIIIPSTSNRYLFIIAPLLALAPSLVAWSVIPFSQGKVLANINAGLLFIFAISSLSVYGILIAGWASNSKYALLGAMR